MLPNPLSPPVPGADAVGRPQLRLAGGTESDPQRDTSTMAAVIQETVHRSHGQWRGTLDAVKEALATLERNCESAIETQEAGVAALIDTLATNAAAEADAAVQQARTQAQAEIAELQRSLVTLHTVVERLQTDLDVARDSMKSLQSQLDVEVAARVRAETERDEARHHCQQQAAAAAAEMAVLRSESDAQKAELTLALLRLDSAVAERSKLMATFQMVQRALAQGAPEDTIPVQDLKQVVAVLPESPGLQLRAEKSATMEVPAVAAITVTDARAILADEHPEAVEDAKRVLEQVEAMYQLDLNSGRPGMEVVDSLTGSLRYSRDAFVARWSESCDAETLFEYQVDLLLHTHASTSFGRHLSIAAYEARQHAAPPAQAHPGTTRT